MGQEFRSSSAGSFGCVVHVHAVGLGLRLLLISVAFTVMSLVPGFEESSSWDSSDIFFSLFVTRPHSVSSIDFGDMVDGHLYSGSRFQNYLS